MGHTTAVSDALGDSADPAASLSVGVSLNPCGSPVDVTGRYVPSGVEVCVLVHVESGGSNFSGATVSLSDTQGSTFVPLSPSQGWVTNGAGEDWAIFYSPIVAYVTDTITATATGSGYSGSGQATMLTGAASASLTLNVTGGSDTEAGGPEAIVAELSWNPGTGFWVPVVGAVFTAIGSDGRTLYSGPPSLDGNGVLIEFDAPSGIPTNETYQVTVFASMLGYTIGEGRDLFQVFSLGNPSKPFPYLPAIVVIVLILLVVAYFVGKRRQRRREQSGGPPAGAELPNSPDRPTSRWPGPPPAAPGPPLPPGSVEAISPQQTPLPQEGNESSNPTNFCPRCGQPSSGADPLCSSCGSPLFS
jgi:hypothetical protein